MNQPDIERFKYPIGKFQRPQEFNENDIVLWKEILRNFPEHLKQEVLSVSDDELNFIYRPGGWSIKQVVHHLADSHMNVFIRFKLALTESTPTIKPYAEDVWATLPDTLDAPIEWSLQILEGVHKRWVKLLDAFKQQDFHKIYYHPGTKRETRLFEALGLYAWHCNHHLAHIKLAKKFRNTF